MIDLQITVRNVEEKITDLINRIETNEDDTKSSQTKTMIEQIEDYKTGNYDKPEIPPGIFEQYLKKID